MGRGGAGGMGRGEGGRGASTGAVFWRMRFWGRSSALGVVARAAVPRGRGGLGRWNACGLSVVVGRQLGRSGALGGALGARAWTVGDCLRCRVSGSCWWCCLWEHWLGFWAAFWSQAGCGHFPSQLGGVWLGGVCTSLNNSPFKGIRVRDLLRGCYRAFVC